MSNDRYHVHTVKCLENGCSFYVETPHNHSGIVESNSEFAAHQIMHPEHLTTQYDDSYYCAKNEEYVKPYVKDGKYINGYCRKRKRRK